MKICLPLTILASILMTLIVLALAATQPSQAAVDWATRDAHMVIFLAREDGKTTTRISRATCQLAEDVLLSVGYTVEYDGTCVVSWE